MPRRHLHLADHAERLRAALDAIHTELKVPTAFPAEVRAEAVQAAARGSTSGRDLTDVSFVTIDPPSSMDLDQAVHMSRAAQVSWSATRSPTLLRSSSPMARSISRPTDVG
jgi:exoribonuclease R